MSPRLDDPDGLYEALVEAHRGLEAEASRKLDARLVLLLANHIGSVAVVREAIGLALQAGALQAGHAQKAAQDPAA
jgi:hypothetical protein